MAEFNPNAQVSDTQLQSNLGDSRGTGPNQSFEALFSGIGDAVNAGVSTADTFVQNKIEDEARYGFESTNDEMNLTNDTVPAELTRSAGGLQKLAMAQMQGKVTQEYYYSRLSATLKGLRTRYPGYEKQVDEIVQNVTGTRPANAYRDALFQNIQNTEQALATGANKWDQWTSQKENSEVLGVLFPDYFTNQEKYASEEAKANIRSQVSQYQGRTRIAEDTVKLQSADKAVAKPQVGKLFSTVVNGYIVGGSEAAGIDQPNVQSMMTKALADGKVDQNEKEGLIGVIAQIRASATGDIRKRSANAAWGSNFTAAEINEEVKNALTPLDEMEAMITSDNLSGAAQIAARNKALTDQATADIYEKFPEILVAGAIKNVSQVGADTLIDKVYEKSGGGMSFLNKTLGKDFSSAVTGGQMTMSKVVEGVTGASGKTGKEKEQLLSSVLDSATAVIAAPTADPAIVKQTVQNVYSDDLDAVWKVVDDSTGSKGLSQRARLYNKMFNPTITKQIAALGDAEAIRTYTAAAMDKFQQIPEFRRAGSTLNEAIEWNKYARVNYDPEKNRLVVQVNKEALGNQGFFQRGDQNLWKGELVKGVDAFNQALTTMAPIIEANGGDETEGVQQLAKNLALNLQGEHKEGFYWYINDALGALGAGANETEGDRKTKTDPNQTGTWEDVGATNTDDSEDVSWEMPEGENIGGALAYASTGDNTQSSPFDAVLRAGPGYTETRQSDGSVVRRTGARNWRNNNPGNIEYGKFAKSAGAVGSDGRFAVFPSYEAGREAKAKLLFESPGYRSKTIAGAIDRYAPPFENNTNAYTNAVARAVGVSADTPVSELTQEQRVRMLNAMERVEGFKVGRETIVAGK